MKLGEILIQLGQITPEQLDAGLRAQETAGGRLGTHLVELGFIGTDQLSLALSRQMGVPAALERHFSRADPTIVAMLKASLAVRYLAVPLAASRNGVKQVVAAMSAPLTYGIAAKAQSVGSEGAPNYLCPAPAEPELV